MGKKGKNRGGQNVRIIRVKKQPAGYEPPQRSHSTSSEDAQRKPSSADLFQGYGAVDLNEKEDRNPSTRKSDDSRAAAINQQKSAVAAPIIRPKGLTNLGNTCYFNSVLQVLSQTRLLREMLAQISADGCEWEAIHVQNVHPHIRLKEQQQQSNGEPSNKRSNDNEQDNDNNNEEISMTSDLSPENLIVSLPPAFEIFNCFTDSLREMRSPSGSAVFTPNRLLNILGRKSCQFRGRDQQDSHELLRTLLDMIRTDEVRRKRKAVLTCLGVSDVKNVDDDTKAKVKSYAASCNFSTIDSLFGGYILSTVRCEECDSTSQIFEQFYDLSLPISEGHPLPHAHQNGNSAASTSGNNKKNNGTNQRNNNTGNRRGWEKKNKTTSDSTAIPLPAPAAVAAAAAPEEKKSESGDKDSKSIHVPGTGSSAFKANNSSSSGNATSNVKNRKQMRAEKKAVRRAVKLERKKQESVKAKTSTGTHEPADAATAAGADSSAQTQSKDVTDAAHKSTTIIEEDEEDHAEGHVDQNSAETNEDDFDIGDMVPLFSDLSISEKGNGSEKDEVVKHDASTAGPPDDASASAAAGASSTLSLSPGRGKDHCEGCDSNSNFRIDMSYSMNASHKNLDVRLQIETRNECNVNLAINHKTASGNRSTSFECSLKAEAAADAVDQKPQQHQEEELSEGKGADMEEQQHRCTQADDLSVIHQRRDPAVKEVASENDDEDNDDDEDKDEDRISSLSGGRRGDEEDEGVDNDSDAASSTRAMIDDQDLDDQMNLLAIDDALDDWSEGNVIEQFTVRGDGNNEPFEDLEPPDVLIDDDPLLMLLPDDSSDHNHTPLLRLPQHPEVHSAEQQEVPADSAAYVTDSIAPAIIPPQGAQNDLKHQQQPLTESSCASPATTDDVIRRIRCTSESVAAVKRKVNWTLKTAEPSFTVSDNRNNQEAVPSIESCLSVFTLPELLTGSNKLSCDNCSRLRQKEATGSSSLPSPGAKECKVFSNASKQMLIAYPPIILTLHLKRFYAEGYGQMHLRKINRHVKFPFILNLGPWVSQMYQKMGQEMGVSEEAANGTSLYYRLYGLVEHSGTLRSGHYTAMIRVRRKEQQNTGNRPHERQDDDSKAMRAKYLRMKPFISSVESFLDSLHDLDHHHQQQQHVPAPQTGETGEPQQHVNNNNDNNDTDSGVCSISSNQQPEQQQLHLLSDDQKRLQSERIDTISCNSNDGMSSTSVNNKNNNGNSCKSNHCGNSNNDMNRKDEKRKTLQELEEDDENDKWFYVSDSHVAPTTRESVLNAQAYILFYERI